MNSLHFNDFYYLEAMAHESTKHSNSAFWNKIKDTVTELQDELIPPFAESIMSYLFLASLGEARHSLDEQLAESLFIKDFVGFPDRSRSGTYEVGLKYEPRESSRLLVQIFNGQEWKGSFGGKRWGDIAKAVEMYWTHPAAVFIDHVADLQHNGGTAFSKPTHNAIMFMTSHPAMKSFLSWKLHRDLLRSPNNWGLTPKVYSLLVQIRSKLNEDITSDWEKIGTLEHKNLEFPWEWKPVKWGTKVINIGVKYRNFLDVWAGNNMPMEDVNNIIAGAVQPNRYKALLEIATKEEFDAMHEILGSRNNIIKTVQEVWNDTRPEDGAGFSKWLEQSEEKILAVAGTFAKVRATRFPEGKERKHSSRKRTKANA